MQDKEAMETAVRAFEDWEFRVLEKESGIDDEEGSPPGMEHGSDTETEKELISQQLLVAASQVNNKPYTPQSALQALCMESVGKYK